MHSTREVAFDSVKQSQEVFRLLLDAMARPGKVVSLPSADLAIPAPWPTSLGLVALTLLDREVGFAVPDDPSGELTGYLQVNTLSPSVPYTTADILFAFGDSEALPRQILAIRPGTLGRPHDGATLVFAVEAIGAGPVALTLEGPGIQGQRQVAVAGLAPGALLARSAVSASYPTGIDLILVDRVGRAFCLPRTTICGLEVAP